MGLRGRPMPPPTQNVRPFRASSLRSNRSSVLTVESSLSSPFHSPHMVHRAPQRRRDSGQFHPRPVARGRPLRAQQSIRRMPPASPQPSLKYMPQPASPRFSPRLSRQSSPHLPPRSAHPPTYAPETYVSGHYADPYGDPSNQFLAPSSPMLSGALQNQAIRQASFASPIDPEPTQMVDMGGGIVPEYMEPYAPSSPSLSGALQNQVIGDASFVSSLQTPMSPYEQPMAPSSPMLSHAMHNQAIMGASYVSPLQRPMSHEQPMAPSSPMLSGALQNQAVREASYVSPLQRPQSSVPSTPMLSRAMRHGQALSGVASYQTPQIHSPYGPTVVTPYDYISEPGPSPLLHDALQNRSPLQNVSSLRSPVMQRRNPYAPAGPQLHDALQQNPNVRQASYRTPVQLRQSPYGPPPPSSPMLGGALRNQQLMQASYRLPDGSLVSPYAASPSSPLLGRAMQNQQVRGASYTLPDGSVIRVGGGGTCQNDENTCHVCLSIHGETTMVLLQLHSLVLRSPSTHTGPTYPPEANVSGPFKSTSEPECPDCYIYSPRWHHYRPETASNVFLSSLSRIFVNHVLLKADEYSSCSAHSAIHFPKPGQGSKQPSFARSLLYSP